MKQMTHALMFSYVPVNLGCLLPDDRRIILCQGRVGQ